LEKIRALVNSRVIVKCHAEKDGKIIVINYEEYRNILLKELEQFRNFSSDQVDIHSHLDGIRDKCTEILVNLHIMNVIDDIFLFHTVGMKFNDGVYRKVTGASAKHFRSNDVAYAYPLFKTHKLEPKDLQAVRVENIPVRLLQSAGSMITSQVTAFLEHLLKPISVLYCSVQPVEYCQDSRQYISGLLMWQTKNLHVIQDKLSESPLFIVAADVKGLYPNVRKDLVQRALSRTLDKHSKFYADAREAILQLNNVCLSNVITHFESKFYIQDKGIVTSDNVSVTLANNIVHYILEPYSLVLEKAEIFRRFIDDIV